MKLILASSSPRRAEILRDAGIAFEICATHIDEAALPGETAHAMVARLAEAKARAAAAQLDAGSRECIIVGADTTVELDGEILGKPRDAADAREMLCQTRRAHSRCPYWNFPSAIAPQCHACGRRKFSRDVCPTRREGNCDLRGDRRAAGQSRSIRDPRNRRTLHFKN